MRESSVKFEMEHLDRYAIIDKPCTIIVKNNSSLNYDNIYDPEENPRWILNIKAITRGNLELLKSLTEQKMSLSYLDMRHLLMTGVIWEDQIKGPSDLPSKGEEIIAVFDHVEGILRCTNITLIPRLQPDLYLHASAIVNEIEEFEKIIKNMRDD